MSFVHLQSDHLYTWSDENRNRAFCKPEKTPSGAVAAIAATQGGPPRLADRTLQALRQARVQMRRRSWPWPQILSFGEPLGLAATNGLCAAGISRPGCRIHCQLSACIFVHAGVLRRVAYAPALGPLLFDDEDHEAAQAQRSSIVASTERSQSAQQKAASKQTAEGLPVHSFRSLLMDLATLTRNRVRMGEQVFNMLATPTAVQARALELLQVRL